MRRNAECGVRSAEWGPRFTPHPALRTPHFVAGAGVSLVLLLLLVTMVAPAIAMACPGCKESLFDPAQLPQRLATARGYALSIGLMLAMPLGLVVGVALLILRAQHRERVD